MSLIVMPKPQLSRSKGFRASKPKVRTGCSTCKPDCMRCARFGRTCGGYDVDKLVLEEVKTVVTSERTLVPRCVAVGPSTQLFENEQEFSFFRYYRDETVAHLAGALQVPVWSRIILQASHEEEFIRHAVIAIGSLSKRESLEWTNGSQCSSPEEFISSDSPRTDDKFVLEHYNKFLQGSRKAVNNGNKGTRMALIVCLLIICVEGLQWHHRSMLKHLVSSINMLDEWVSSQPKPAAIPGINSPNPEVVEDEIVQQLRMLQLEGSIFVDPKPRSYHERLRQEGNDTINQMPKSFSSTPEAREHLELIMRRTHHFMGTVMPQKPDPAVSQTDPDAQSFTASFSTFETVGGAVRPLQFEQERYTSENRRWNQAFEALYRSRMPNDSEFLATRLLKIRSRTLGILFAGELSTTEMIYDDFLAEFEEILTLAKVLFHHPSAEHLILDGSYSSNAGLIFPLRLVADRCRSRTIRREAIALLQSRSWRESSFWSTSTAQVSEWLMEVEEAGVDTEHIPEWARARLLEVQFVEGKAVKRVSVKCVRGVGQKAEVREASWGWGPESSAGSARSESIASMNYLTPRSDPEDGYDMI